MFKDPGGPRPKHRVYALLAGGRVIYIGVAAAGQPSWEVTWEHRERIDNALARLFRSIAEKPTEVMLLGTVGLHKAVAYQAAALLGDWFPGALVEKPRRGGGRAGWPVSWIKGGRVMIFPSRAAAARSVGVCRQTIARWLRRGGEWIDEPNRHS
jgi:hypothetical protein